jgi:hypothetical protein
MQDRQPSHKAPGANLEATWQSRVELRRPSRTKNIQPVGCSGINKLPLLHLFPCCAVPPALSPGSHLCRGPNCPARYSGRLGIPSGTEYSTAKHWKAGNPKVACQCNKDAFLHEDPVVAWQPHSTFMHPKRRTVKTTRTHGAGGGLGPVNLTRPSRPQIFSPSR